MKKCAANYIEHFLWVEHSTKTVWLPEMFRFYWKDFGGNRAKVLSNICTKLLAGTQFGAELEPILCGSNAKPKVNFVTFDWTEMIVF